MDHNFDNSKRSVVVDPNKFGSILENRGLPPNAPTKIRSRNGNHVKSNSISQLQN